MKKIFKIKESYFYYFLLIYFLFGIYLSLEVGITHDEAHSNWVWELNKYKILNIFFNKSYDVGYLDTYHGYYGAGFYFISSLVENIFSGFIDKNKINAEGIELLIKHPTVFLFFIFSSIYFKKIIFLITKDKIFSNLSAVLFLTYPYLFGHSLFNIKDIPFMSVWLICTYFLINILNGYFSKNKFKIKNIFILAILTSYLLSLRISGILIFIQYLVFLAVFLNISKVSIISFLKDNIIKISIFFFTFFISLYLFYPSFWGNPLKFYDSILFMSQHIQTVCTTTLGTCMKAQNLPSSYIFIWLLFKLPIFIIIGLLLFPFVEKQLFENKTNILVIGSSLITVFTIIFILIFFEANLYDELRQVLFLIPFLFIISLVTLYYYKKKLTLILTTIFIIFFSIQNLKIFPFNYLWLNNLNILVDVNKNFELDYWGVSTKKIANFINEKKLKKNSCIISNRIDGIKYYTSKQNNCFKTLKELHKKNERPFYVALTERALNKGLPNNCKLIYNDNIKLNFSEQELVLSKFYECFN